MFGWAAHEVLGRPLTVIIPERYREMHSAGLERVAATGQSKLAGTVVELVALRRDGSEFPVELSIGVFDAVEGRGFSAVLRDISERKRAEEALRTSEERFRSLADSAPDAIVSADAAGRVLSWNTGAERMFGWDAADMIGHPLTLIIPDRFRAAHIAGLARVAASGESKLAGTVVELVGLRRDGTEFPVELSIGVWDSAQGPGFSAVLRDITDRKEAEEAVAQASREVERANAELETLIYSASHDLKSPMISVLGYLDYLKVDYGEVLGVEGTRYLERMTDCTLYMQRLIQDLLKLSRVGRLESEVVRLDLQELIARIADELGEMHPQATFSLRSLPMIEGDPMAFRQLFTNLVENAVQHAERPDVTVLVSSRRLPDGGAEISVRDNGKGIPQQYRELVFGIFERLDGGRAAGTGMGLAICRKIVEQFGGKIWLTGNEGADVRVHLPRSLVVEDRLPAMTGAASEARA
jgi:two-component system, LuxR family, sensor kinase FixL